MNRQKKTEEGKIDCRKCKHFVDVIPWTLVCYITAEELETSKREFCEDYEEQPIGAEGIDDGPFY